MYGMMEQYRAELDRRQAVAREHELLRDIARIADVLEGQNVDSGRTRRGDAASPPGPGEAADTPPEPSLRMLDTKEAAERLGVTPPVVRRLVKRGLLPKRRNGRRFYFFEADLLRASDPPVPAAPRTVQLASTRASNQPAPLPPVLWEAPTRRDR
jgi:excisionase family DNA binding protein